MNEFKKLMETALELLIVGILVLSFFSMALFACAPGKKLTIPQEPTIWVVSEIYKPTRKEFNGMVSYKLIPVNPGSINAKPTWKLDYQGKYYVGQRLDFAPLEVDGKGLE